MIKANIKQWGNSLGIIIPKEDVKRMNLKTGESLVVEIRKKENVFNELFGSMNIKDPKKELKNIRKELKSKCM